MLNRQKTNLSDKTKLYLVGTPIGNFDDMTYRAVDTLKMVDDIYCEDTRITGKLLEHFQIDAHLHSYHIYNEQELTSNILSQIQNGKNIAIVSDAGMPSISDPGYLACVKAIEANIDVVVIPGVSASLTALVGSGITSNTFTFMGFLNSKDTKRKKELIALKDKTETLIIYEAPHRIQETLEMLAEIMPTRQIVLARELTKKYEEYLRGTASEILTVINELKGEMVLIVSGASLEEVKQNLLDLTIKEHYQYYFENGYDKQTALKMVARDRDVSKSDIYQEVFGKNK